MSVITVGICSNLQQRKLIELFEIFLSKTFSTDWTGEILQTPRVNTLFMKEMITRGPSDLFSVCEYFQADNALLLILYIDNKVCIGSIFKSKGFRRHVFLEML